MEYDRCQYASAYFEVTLPPEVVVLQGDPGVTREWDDLIPHSVYNEKEARRNIIS